MGDMAGARVLLREYRATVGGSAFVRRMPNVIDNTNTLMRNVPPEMHVNTEHSTRTARYRDTQKDESTFAHAKPVHAFRLT